MINNILKRVYRIECTIKIYFVESINYKVLTHIFELYMYQVPHLYNIKKVISMNLICMH